ncbi:MAG: radical SAM protein, partial [archaeon]
KKKKKYLDAVCVSGGECTLYKDELYEFLRKVKNMGYLTKIDTNGTKPYFINKLINNNMLDYIAMDIKAPLNNYNLVTQSNVDIEKIRMSINIIKSSKISSEFRTTVCKELITINDIEKISELIKGSKKYIIQNFKDGDTILAGENKFTPYTRGELNEIINKIQDKFEICKYR